MQDLPLLARGITAAIRGKAKSGSGVFMEIPYVYLHAADFSVVVLAEDWRKIEPLLLDGSLDPLLTPVPRVAHLDPEAVLQSSLVDSRDRGLYDRVLARLQLLFTDPYPNSTI